MEEKNVLFVHNEEYNYESLGRVLNKCLPDDVEIESVLLGSEDRKELTGYDLVVVQASALEGSPNSIRRFMELVGVPVAIIGDERSLGYIELSDQLNSVAFLRSGVDPREIANKIESLLRD